MKWLGMFTTNDNKTAAATGAKGIGPQLTITKSGHDYEPKIWAVGGGKGGVGKSLLAVNLGILLSKQGYRVLLVDADLGAANLHTFMNIEGGKLPLSSFLKGSITELQPLITKTSIPNLELISGAKDSLDVTDINGRSILRLKRSLRKVNFDYIILDVGPGTASNTLDIFLIADEGIILTTPEPTSVENTYRFVKCLILRRMRHIINSQADSKLKELLQKIFSNDWPQRVKTISDIIAQLEKMDRKRGEVLKSLLGDIGLSIIINQTRRPEDKEIGYFMKKACDNYFGTGIGYLGDVCHDDFAEDSIRSRRPLSIHYSGSMAALAIEACLQNLIKNEKSYELLQPIE